MTNDTRVLTIENVSLRPSNIIAGAFIVDLHACPYDGSQRAIGVASIMPDYLGGYHTSDWTTGVSPIGDHSPTLGDAIAAVTQHLSPFTFTD